MDYRDLAFFGLYILIGALVWVTYFLQPPTIIAAAAAVGVGISIPAANRIEEILERRSQAREKRDEIREFVKQFETRANELGLEPSETEAIPESFLAAGREITKENVYEVATEESFSDYNPHQRNIIHILIICRAIAQSQRAVEQAKLKTRISSLMEDFNLNTIDSQTEEFLGAFEEARSAIESGTNPPDELFGHEADDSHDSALRFATEFGTTEQLAVVLFNDKERSEELRRTLGRLIARGKLSSKSVNRETAQRIQNELEQMGDESTKFMLFSQKMHYSDDVTDAIEKFPHIRPSYKNPESGFPEHIKYMRIYVVYPEADYGTAQNFLESEIFPQIPDDSAEDGFIAAMPLRLEELEIHPEVEEIEDFLTGTYEALNFLKTGSNEDLAEIVSDRVMSEIGVSKVLATIPFNILEPDLSESEKEVIIQNYDHLKEQFGVERLFDWSDVSADKLAEELHELDGGTNLDRWSEISESITEQASEYSEAVYP